MKIEGDLYKICYDSNTATVNFNGSLRLNGTEEYSPILNLLFDVVEQDPPRMTLNLLHLEFLNSSGITMLSKFVVEMRKKTIHLMIIGSNTVPWQSKTLKNLQRLMPDMNMKFI